MHLQTVALIAALLFIICLAVLRTPRRIRRWVIVLVPLPTAFLMIRWAAYRHAWPDFLAGAGVCFVGLGIWWAAFGRRLPPASDDGIRVWSKDDPF